MICPNCTDQRLVMSERSGIEIDYCPNCRGVWLDRGELDKIVERAARELAPPSAAPQAVPTPAPAPPVAPTPGPAGVAAPPPPVWGHSSRSKEYGYQPAPYDDGYYKRKKRRSFLDELFD